MESQPVMLLPSSLRPRRDLNISCQNKHNTSVQIISMKDYTCQKKKNILKNKNQAFIFFWDKIAPIKYYLNSKS